MTATAITINADKCLKDGFCISVCPCLIFEKTPEGVPAVNTELAKTCIKCGHCASVCPGNAIKVSELDPADYLPMPADIPTLQTFSNLIRARRSIRAFKPQQIPVEKIKEMLEIIKFCPTAKNSQSLSWILIDGSEKVRNFSAAVIDAFRINERMKSVVEEFDQGGDPIHRGAPQVLVAYGSSKYPWGTMDAAIAIANLELAAKACGFGSCWGGFSTWAASGSSDVGKSIGLSEDKKIFGVLMLGYPKIRYRYTPPRKPLNLKIV